MSVLNVVASGDVKRQIHKFLYLKSLLKLDVQSEGWKMVILIKREKRLVLIINLLFFYLSLVEKVEEN